MPITPTTSLRHLPRLCCATLLLLATRYPILATPELIIDQRFAIQNLTTQTPPSSLAWFPSHDFTASNRGANLRLLSRTAVGGRAAAAHFPRVELKPGDILTLALEFELGAPPADNNNALRFGLFDSDNNPKNQFTKTADPSVSSKGILLFLNPNNARGTSTLTIYKRDTKGSLITDERLFAARNTPRYILPDPLIVNRKYRIETALKVISPKQLQLIFELSGGGLPTAITHTETIGNPPTLNFDTLALGIQQPGLSDIYFTRIQLIREPAP